MADLISLEEVQTFGDAIDELKAMIESERAGWATSRAGGQHHTATVRKCRRILEGMVSRFKALLVQENKSKPIEMDDLFVEGKFNVIDVQRLRPPAQRLVISKIYEDTVRILERGHKKVDKVIYLVDELNKFAPREAAKGPMAGIKSIIDDMASRGRSIGAILLGIQQYPSQISNDVVGNVATFMYCRMKPAELSATIYRGVPKEVRQIIQRLPKGYAIIVHDTFTGPIIARFPRPPCAQIKPPAKGEFESLAKTEN